MQLAVLLSSTISALLKCKIPQVRDIGTIWNEEKNKSKPKSLKIDWANLEERQNIVTVRNWLKLLNKNISMYPFIFY